MTAVNETDFDPNTPVDLIPYIDALDDLLVSEKYWTQEKGARDAAGKSTFPMDPAACRWCLVGGMWKVTYRVADIDHHTRLHRELALCFRLALDAREIPLGVAEFNDSSTFDQVKQLIADARVIANLPIDQKAAQASVQRVYNS